MTGQNNQPEIDSPEIQPRQLNYEDIEIPADHIQFISWLERKLQREIDANRLHYRNIANRLRQLSDEVLAVVDEFDLDLDDNIDEHDRR